MSEPEPIKELIAELREKVARIIGSFVVVDDHGGPDTITLHDELGGHSHEENTRRLYVLTDQIIAVQANALSDLQARVAEETAKRESAEAHRDEITDTLLNHMGRITEEMERAQAAEARVAELEGALKPFAEVSFSDFWLDATHLGSGDRPLTIGHFRRASAALLKAPTHG